MSDDHYDVLIVGAGPCGLAAAISSMRAGLTTVVVDAGVVVSTIAHYPFYARFFSTAEKLSIGDVPFIVADDKPTRREALVYYRTVVRQLGIPLRQYERVTSVTPAHGLSVTPAKAGAQSAVTPAQAGAHVEFVIRSTRADGTSIETHARNVIIATGYFGAPNKLDVPGEDLPQVAHVFREGHEAFDQDVVVVGGGNSAAEAALDLWRAGARVTLVHFGATFDKKIKPWVLPDFNNRVAEGAIRAVWNARVTSISERSVMVGTSSGAIEIPAARVYAMTGFAPDLALLRATGVPIDARTGIPAHDPATLETTVPGLFIAGVVVAGFDANKVFIENGRYHGDRIVARILGRERPPEPQLSTELDT